MTNQYHLGRPGIHVQNSRYNTSKLLALLFESQVLVVRKLHGKEVALGYWIC
jgi:hypothetical protein